MTVASASLGTLSSLRARKQEEPSPRSKPSWESPDPGGLVSWKNRKNKWMIGKSPFLMAKSTINGLLMDINGLLMGYPLVIWYIAIENDHRNSGFSVIFHSYVSLPEGSC